MKTIPPNTAKLHDRRYFIGGSVARVIMGDDEAALVRLWREKHGDPPQARVRC